MKKTFTKSILIAILYSFWGYSNYANAQSIAGGFWHSLFLCNGGTAQAVGINNYGQLGDGTTVDKFIPVMVSGLTGVTEVASGNYHSLYLKNDGTVWAVGHNLHGQLGNGTSSNTSTTLVQVNGLVGITAVAGGAEFSLFLKNDGTVWAAGNNVYGQLGNGVVLNTTIPVQVQGLTGITAIAAGNQHSLFLKNDGSVWAVGRNNFGQLGDGTLISKTSPVQVLGLTGITAIATGWDHNIFLKSDGTVWAVGRNFYGQLGDGTTVDKSTPVQMITGLTGITSLACGGFHSLVLKNDGTVWVVGRNSSGQLGDGTTVNKSTLIQVPGLIGVTSVAGGTAHSLFQMNEGTVWAVGLNNFGQLGDGTTVNKISPVQVSGLCVSLGTEESIDEYAISVYPNPSNAILNIQNMNSHVIDKIVVTDIIGKIVLNQNGGDSIDIQNLQKGIYLLHVLSGGNVFIKKFIKE